MSKWISVKDRLPEKRKEVLVYDRDGFEIVTAYISGYDGAWYETVEGIELDGVTHWMPLPDPPEVNE